MNAYWKVNEINIETLISGKSANGGYIAWDWGGKAMVGSSTAVAFSDTNSGNAILNDYYDASLNVKVSRLGISKIYLEYPSILTLIGRSSLTLCVHFRTLQKRAQLTLHERSARW
jgi:energy-converting hydrogenase Eha subunit E